MHAQVGAERVGFIQLLLVYHAAVQGLLQDFLSLLALVQSSLGRSLLLLYLQIECVPYLLGFLDLCLGFLLSGLQGGCLSLCLGLVISCLCAHAAYCKCESNR